MKENENQKSEELENKRGLELGGSRALSIFNDNYPFFLAYDLTRNLPEEPLPEKETDKPASYLDDPEALKAIEQFKAYSTKIKPPME